MHSDMQPGHGCEPAVPSDEAHALNYDVRGNPHGPTLALIHGFMSSNAQWDLNVDRLGEHLRLVLIELRGHGDSPAPHDADLYKRAAMVDSLEDIRRAAAIADLQVVDLDGGHSVNIEQPSGFDAAVLAFVERTTNGAA